MKFFSKFGKQSFTSSRKYFSLIRLIRLIRLTCKIKFCLAKSAVTVQYNATFSDWQTTCSTIELTPQKVSWDDYGHILVAIEAEACSKISSYVNLYLSRVKLVDHALDAPYPKVNLYKVNQRLLVSCYSCDSYANHVAATKNHVFVIHFMIHFTLQFTSLLDSPCYSPGDLGCNSLHDSLCDSL